jgi:hypothetical protein
MRYVYQLAAPLLLVSIACRSTEEPRHPGTLLVTNATCVPGPCDSVDVLLYPPRFLATPAGPVSFLVGTVTGSSACLHFPLADTSLVISWDTTRSVWTPADPTGLAGLVRGSCTSFACYSWIVPTASFLPTSAAGWSVSLPADTLAHPSEPCTS